MEQVLETIVAKSRKELADSRKRIPASLLESRIPELPPVRDFARGVAAGRAGGSSRSSRPLRRRRGRFVRSWTGRWNALPPNWKLRVRLLCRY